MNMSLSEKGFYAMAYTLSLFATITVQKNVRDKQSAEQSSLSVTGLFAKVVTK
jgi:hypothetical protein